jgi:hypothetical protein
VILIAFYIYREVYVYALKLVTIFIGFLPKFAFPLAVRKSYDDGQKQLSLAPDYCRQCGKQVENRGDAFCMDCGCKLR